MKSLKEIMLESSILDINLNDNVIKKNIEKFIKANYSGNFIISDNPNDDGKYEVMANNDITVKNTNIEHLTNDVFVWTRINGNFNCSFCDSLKTLIDAPKKVTGNFDCRGCKSITSLSGIQKEINGNFYCHSCHSLKTLEGGPEIVTGNYYCGGDNLINLNGSPAKINGDFSCTNAGKLTNLVGAPKEVAGNFTVKNCKNLNSLQGSPKKVKKVYNITFNGTEFDEEDVLAVCKCKINNIVV